MKLEALDHPKTLDLASRLNVELPTAIGYLELLWAFTAKKAPQGDIGKWPNGAIARACFWNKDATVFVTALATAGFIDSHPQHRFVIHDWQEHAPRWVLSKLSRSQLSIYDCSGDYSHDSTGGDSSDSSGDSVREGKGREGKAREGKGDARGEHARASARTATRLPDDFELTEQRRLVAEAEKLPAERTFAKFTDHWRAASGAKARKHDWDATWRNWCLREADDRPNGPSARPAQARPQTAWDRVMEANRDD